MTVSFLNFNYMIHFFIQMTKIVIFLNKQVFKRKLSIVVSNLLKKNVVIQTEKRRELFHN